jgi:hypothetical protein
MILRGRYHSLAGGEDFFIVGRVTDFFRGNPFSTIAPTAAPATAPTGPATTAPTIAPAATFPALWWGQVNRSVRDLARIPRRTLNAEMRDR